MFDISLLAFRSPPQISNINNSYFQYTSNIDIVNYLFYLYKYGFPLNLDSFQLEHGGESEKILKAYFPEVCDEIKGITDTLNIDYIKFHLI